MMDGGHQKHPLVEEAEAEHLDHHAQRLDHEQAADEEDQNLHPGCHGHPRQGGAQSQRPGVAHEDGGGMGVVPQEAQRRAGQNAARMARSFSPRRNAMPAQANNATATVPAASPSRPSVRLTALEKPEMRMKAKT